MRGRNPKGYQQLITKAFKEGDTKYCRAVMRKCIKIIRKHADVEKDLTDLLVSNGYNFITYQIIKHSALSSKTMFHVQKKEAIIYEDADTGLMDLFERIRYKYNKKSMESFF